MGGCGSGLDLAHNESEIVQIAPPDSANAHAIRLSEDINRNPLLSWLEVQDETTGLHYSVYQQRKWSPSREVNRGGD
jgi:hypothetical protein